MSAIALTCGETPLAWPKNVDLSVLNTCTTCGIKVYAPNPGSLQILGRRQQGGVGDGVNVEESMSVGADYRGQRYTYEEAIFHVPGLHVYPGQDKPYPAEYHVHMKTVSKPERSITLVFPVSHLIKQGPGSDYFATAAAKPDPTVAAPTLESILPPDAILFQYQGPDIRGRTRDTPTPEFNCTSEEERQFLLVGTPISVRASDLERIPREGSLSTDPRDLPAPGVAPTQQLSRARVMECVSLAQPGILLDATPAQTTQALVSGSGETKEMECKPLKVVDGRDVIDVNGQEVDLQTLLQGGSASGTPMLGGVLGKTSTGVAQTTATSTDWLMVLGGIVGLFLGLLLANYLFDFVWGWFFYGPTDRLGEWTWIKKLYIFGAPLALLIAYLIKETESIVKAQKKEEDNPSE